MHGGVGGRGLVSPSYPIGRGTRMKQSIKSGNPKKSVPRSRSVQIGFRVTQHEKDMIERRMMQSGMISLRAYMVKMAIDGRVIQVELDSVKEMVRLLSNATNNINQIARVANQVGTVPLDSISQIQSELDTIWEQTQVILQKINQI